MTVKANMTKIAEMTVIKMIKMTKLTIYVI